MNPFTRAAEYMSEHGWTQGLMRSRAGRVCALGALLYANYELPEREVRDLAGWLSGFVATRADLALDGNTMMCVAYWNDRLATSQEEVVAMLRDAAEAWDLETAVNAPSPVTSSAGGWAGELDAVDAVDAEFAKLTIPAPFLTFTTFGSGVLVPA